MTKESSNPSELDLRYRDHLEAVTSLFDVLAEEDFDDEEEPLPAAELAEAESRVLALFAQHDAGVLQTAPEPVAVITIWQEMEVWLAQGQLEAVRSDSTVSVPTQDVVAPGLADLGYAPNVEVDGDVGQDAEGTVDTAQITVRLAAASGGGVPAPTSVRITSSDGSVRTAEVNEFGRAVFSNVRLPATDQSLRVAFLRNT